MKLPLRIVAAVGLATTSAVQENSPWSGLTLIADDDESLSLLQKEVTLARRAGTGSIASTADHPHSAFTTVDCLDSDLNRSCTFRNLYYDSGGWQLWLKNGTSLDIGRVYTADKFGAPMSFQTRYFDDLNALQRAEQERRLEVRTNLTLYFSALFHFNIGHALFDGLYGGFLALVKFGRHNDTFRALVEMDQCDGVRAMAPGDTVLAYLPDSGRVSNRTRKPEHAVFLGAAPVEKARSECDFDHDMDDGGEDLAKITAQAIAGGASQIQTDVGVSAQQAECCRRCMETAFCHAGVFLDGECYLKGTCHGDGACGQAKKGLVRARPRAGPPDVLLKDPYNDDHVHRVPAAWVLEKVATTHKCWSEDIFSVFSRGGERERFSDLQRDAREDSELLVRFDELVVGSRFTGNLGVSSSLAVGGSLAPHHGLRHYRDRMVQTHLGDAALQRVGKSGRSSSQQVQVAIIHNGRFTQDDQAMLKSLANEASNESISAQYVDWSVVGDYKGDFRSHLRRVLDMDVMVSSVGTAMMYLPFLRDGSVFVALGHKMDENTMGAPRWTPFFGEQHMSAGSTWVRTIYYDSKARMEGLQAHEVMKLLHRARDIVQTGFDIPVDITQNLSPEGLVLYDICSRDQAACDKITHLRNEGAWDCLRGLWLEYFVYEIGAWATGGACGGWDTKVTNATVLRTLRKARGLPGFGAPELI
eukprot:gnl/TRDRNA2_/TRDRNA2_48732_c0_seq1.p1 gnl/TRDRNA2_/TRDRNA2_48732_c0~~gnl/TRDRNA2_/TRDRNA2_48732_c0_seq1.p1  ORF type:complete len:700 (-),score=107.06 gnl/TRDRNA2_/TRDRNA2_48732_c0_seq1:3-2102(-)